MLALPVDPTPSAMAEFAERLPLRERQDFLWFPEKLREVVVRPILSAPPDALLATVDSVVFEAIGIFFRLSQTMARLLQLPEVRQIVADPESPADMRIAERIRRRLDPSDSRSADELREAHAWLKAIMKTLVATEALQALETAPTAPGVDEIEQELQGQSGSFLRGILLTVAVSEALHLDEPLPTTTGVLCRLANLEVQAAANALRAGGLDLPTSVQIPGFTPLAWQHRRQAGLRRPLVPTSLVPRELLNRIRHEFAAVEIWLFGSRARGTHGPNSDWDLLVLLADDDDVDGKSERLSAFRDDNVDIVLLRRAEFIETRDSFGTIAHLVSTEGFRVDG